MERLDEWCTTGQIALPRGRDRLPRARLRQRRAQLAREVAAEIRARRILILMLGDTSMGMINGYFGPRLLQPARLHRAQGRSGVDHRPRPRHRRSAIDDALRFVQDKGVTFHWGENAAPRTSTSTRRASSSATTWPCSTWWTSSRPTASAGSTSSACIPLRPPSDFAEGLFNSACRPEIERRHHRLRHRGRSGQRRADGADEAAPEGRRGCTRR